MPEKQPVSEDGSPRRPTRPAPDQPRSAMIAFALLLGGAAAAMFLVGRAEQGNLGVFLLCAGVAMIGCPPLVKVNPWIAGLAALFLLCSGLALLPARLFHVPVWRQAFMAAPDLPLPETVSAAPEQTLFWLGVLIVTVLIGLFALTQPVYSKGLSSFALAGAGVCGAYAALSILARLPGSPHLLSDGATFGFFPNRNHTATLLVTGSVLSVGLLGTAFRQRQRWAINVAVAALTLCVAGLLFFSESRGGVVFLLVGVVGWVAGLGRYRDRALLITIALVVMVGAGLFLTLKMGARDRLLDSMHVGTGRSTAEAAPTGETAGRPPLGAEIAADDRLRIYRDTIDMIRDVPFTGTGLGTFSLVFAPYRQASANYNRVLHPESDWLMVPAETGLPAGICLVGLLALVLRSWKRSREHPYWPLRWGLMSAAGVAALHGWVDVPMHRAALGWWVLVLAGLALQPGRGHEAERVGANRRVARGVFVLGGVLALLLGAQLVRAEWFGGPALPPYFAKRAQEEIGRTFTNGDLAGATDQCQRAIRVTPLASPLYYQLGLLLVREEDTDEQIDRAFRCERVLAPWSPNIPSLQAAMWMPIDSVRSAALFKEALERQERLWQISNREPRPLIFWKGVVEQTNSFPPVQNGLWEVCAGRDPEFALTWLEAADARNVKVRLPQWAADESLLSQLTAEQRRRLLLVWKTKGDPEALQTFLASHGAAWVE